MELVAGTKVVQADVPLDAVPLPDVPAAALVDVHQDIVGHLGAEVDVVRIRAHGYIQAEVIGVVDLTAEEVVGVIGTEGDRREGPVAEVAVDDRRVDEIEIRLAPVGGAGRAVGGGVDTGSHVAATGGSHGVVVDYVARSERRMQSVLVRLLAGGNTFGDLEYVRGVDIGYRRLRNVDVVAVGARIGPQNGVDVVHLGNHLALDHRPLDNAGILDADFGLGEDQTRDRNRYDYSPHPFALHL